MIIARSFGLIENLQHPQVTDARGIRRWLFPHPSHEQYSFQGNIFRRRDAAQL